MRKSCFIAHAIPITSLDQIKGLVQKAREEHPQAVHVVHAAVVGPKGDLYSFSDDREPRNTAGRPAFEVLKGSGITNILILIIRYFGESCWEPEVWLRRMVRASANCFRCWRPKSSSRRPHSGDGALQPL